MSLLITRRAISSMTGKQVNIDERREVRTYNILRKFNLYCHLNPPG